MVQIIVNVLDLGMTVEAAVAAGRIMPEEGVRLVVEERVPSGTRQALAARGYQVETAAGIARVQAVQVRQGGYHGVTDPRAPGGALAY